MAVTAVIFFPPGKDDAQKANRPNILLVTVDTLRADHLSVYGCETHKTPHIDGLAAEGVVFDTAYCDVSWTTPSMASVFTGTYAYRHELRSVYHRLADSQVTAAELLKTLGYNTAAVVGSFPLDSVYGLDQGFDIYDDTYTVPIFTDTRRPAEDVEVQWKESVTGRKREHLKIIRNKSRRTDPEVTRAALPVLEKLKNQSEPFFLWVHYFGPHAVPSLSAGREANWKKHAGSYADKVKVSDREVGTLLKALEDQGLAQNTLVIFHSDHGESLWEHGFVGHGVYLYEDNMRIPLVVRRPGRVPGGKRFKHMVGNIDIAATILDAAGFRGDALKKMDGKSLFEVINHGKRIHDSVYFETYLCAHDANAEVVKIEGQKDLRVGICSYGVAKHPWKYVKTEYATLYDAPGREIPAEARKQVNKDELYHLVKDPKELHSLAEAAKGSPVMKTLLELVELHRAVDQLAAGGKKKRMKMTDDQLQKLKSLGYIK